MEYPADDSKGGFDPEKSFLFVLDPENSGNVSFTRYPDDRDKERERPMTISLTLPEKFEYGSSEIFVNIRYKKEYAARITVFRTGLMLFTSEDIDKIELRESIADKKEEERRRSEKLRLIMREVYFELKEKYHKDIHHETCRDTADGLLSLVEADEEVVAAEKIYSMFVRTCENNLAGDFAQYGKENLQEFQNRYMKTSGFIAYGLNFVNIFGLSLGKDFVTYRESLKCCSESLESQYEYYRNRLTQRENKNIETMNIKLNRLTWALIGVSAFNAALFLYSIFS
jgi:hypothetical protein